MELRECIFYSNDCYRRGLKIVPRGVMVHSTGANNPNLRRYVQPDDGLLGSNGNQNDWNRPGLDVCVHAFIGRKADGTVATYQTLPWDRRGWHAGSGSVGSANNTHISFEICEDGLNDRAYFETVWREAVELTAYLCARYGLDPMADGVVIDHAEGHRRGIASNHGDVTHWLTRYGLTMDDFRQAVAENSEVERMTKQELEKLIDRRIAAKLDGDGTTPSKWAEQELSDAERSGITDGTRPRGYATREETAVMVERLRKRIEKE